MQKIALLFIFIHFSLPGFAWISEERDDNHKTICGNGLIDVEINELQVTISGEDTEGKPMNFKGELVSLTIDTSGNSLSYQVILEDNIYNLRYFTMRDESIDGFADTGFHYDISTVAGSLGEVSCFVQWKSSLEE